jgi:hypothetical protein
LAEIEWNRDPDLWLEYTDGFNDYLKDRIIQGYRKRKSQMISNWMENSKSELESFGLQFEESEYAKKNPEEWFAETFASLESGQPTDTAKDLEFKLETKGFIRGEK